MSFIGRSQSNHDKGISSPWILVAGGFASATMSLMIYKFHKHYIEQKKFYYIPERPSLIEEAKANDKPIYYFGVGSNMLRSKVESRAVDGSKIEIISMEPGLVKGYRVAFNLRALPPIEPSMASIEPVKDPKALCLTHEGALHANGDLTCHGALIALKPDMYHKLFLSESGGKETSGYMELVVTVEPYDESKEPVQAIAFTTKPEARLPQDFSPSARYMSLLVEGAHELGLDQNFQNWLQTHPVQRVPYVLRKIALNNMFFTFPLMMFLPKLRIVGTFQSWLVWSVYVPTKETTPVLTQFVSNIAMGGVLLPGAFIGYLLRLATQLSGKSPPKMMQTMLDWEDPPLIAGHRGVGPFKKKVFQ